VRYAVVSDVHANLEALRAVLDAARDEGARRVVCAGDLVGYHADPDESIELLRRHDALSVAGNHDRVAAGLAEPARFGAVARRAIAWTARRLSPEGRAFLARLPISLTADRGFLLVHGALHPTPNVELHLSSDARVARSIRALQGGPWGVRLAFFGHTHRGAVHEARGAAWRSLEGPMVELVSGCHYLVNPGSVGQPRDGDPRASFVIYDDEAGTLRFHRVPFDRGACLAKAAREGLLAGDSPRRSGPLALLGALCRRLS
jgi:predicted phosphodiesterase